MSDNYNLPRVFGQIVALIQQPPHTVRVGPFEEDADTYLRAVAQDTVWRSDSGISDQMALHCPMSSGGHV